MIQYGSGNFEVSLRNYEDSEDFDVILTGQINVNIENKTPQFDTSKNTKRLKITKLQFYSAFEQAGYHLGDEFTLVQGFQRNNLGGLKLFREFPNLFSKHKISRLFDKIFHLLTEYGTSIMWNGNWVTFLDALMKVQMFADNGENVDFISPFHLRRLEISVSQFMRLEKGARDFDFLFTNERTYFDFYFFISKEL